MAFDENLYPILDPSEPSSRPTSIERSQRPSSPRAATSELQYDGGWSGIGSVEGECPDLLGVVWVSIPQSNDLLRLPKRRLSASESQAPGLDGLLQPRSTNHKAALSMIGADYIGASQTLFQSN